MFSTTNLLCKTLGAATFFTVCAALVQADPPHGFQYNTSGDISIYTFYPPCSGPVFATAYAATYDPNYFPEKWCAPESYYGDRPLTNESGPNVYSATCFPAVSEFYAVDGDCGVNLVGGYVNMMSSWLAVANVDAVSFSTSISGSYTAISPEARQCEQGSTSSCAATASEHQLIIGEWWTIINEPGYILVQTAVARTNHVDEGGDGTHVTWQFGDGGDIHDWYDVGDPNGPDLVQWGWDDPNRPRAFPVTGGTRRFRFTFDHGSSRQASGETISKGISTSAVVLLRYAENDYLFFEHGDVNGDLEVDLADLSAVLASYGNCAGDDEYNPLADLNGDGCANLGDLSIVLSNYGNSLP